jgi:hypothetical protein
MVMSGDAPSSPAEPLPATEQPAEQATGSAEASGAGEIDVLPADLAGLPLTAWIDGDRAKVQTEQLHGKGLGQGFDEAWIGHYGLEGEGTLWVSRSASVADAQTLMDRMTVSIEKGTSPFTNLAIAEVDAVPVASLDGMGQKHYYFLVATDLYWLGIAPALSEAAFTELLDNARKVTGG